MGQRYISSVEHCWIKQKRRFRCWRFGSTVEYLESAYVVEDPDKPTCSGTVRQNSTRSISFTTSARDSRWAGYIKNIPHSSHLFQPYLRKRRTTEAEKKREHITPL